MKRISTDKEFLESGTVVIDADGVTVELGADSDPVDWAAAIAAFNTAVA